MPSIAVQCLPVGEYHVNCYLVENRDTGDTFIVDPGGDGQQIIQAVGSRKPAAVLLTHGHYDHMGGVDEVCDHFGIPLYLHALDLPKLTDDGMNCSRRFGLPMTVATQATPMQDGQRLPLGGVDITVLHTPGHSAGSCCFLLPDGQGVLCGDTFFDGGYGRTDFEDGSFQELKQSLRKLMALSPRMTAYPGHGAFTQTGRDGAAS